ncbi:MAG: transposase [Aestuariivita sp.]|nr:transposase [Aestuariivita sp.]
MPLSNTIAGIWNRFQGELFPNLAENLGPLTANHQRFVTVLDLKPVETFIQTHSYGRGRPLADRRALARAFIAKAVWNLSTTRALIDRLQCDPKMRRLCGWERVGDIPSESTFSRAFAWFAETALPERMHAALIASAFEESVVGHISRDSTAIEAREKPTAKAKGSTPKTPRKRGRPRKGETRPKEPRRLDRQLNGGLSLKQMLADLPKAGDIGTKRNAKGYKTSWQGYKFHLDVSDGDIPISGLLTSASLHDSQASLPLATMTKRRVDYGYELMDAAYDCSEIHQYAKAHGHVALIDPNPRRNRARKQRLAEEARALKVVGQVDPAKERYKQRSSVERVNGALKDRYGGRHIRVQGATKVACHLFFGILALTVEQLLRLQI